MLEPPPVGDRVSTAGILPAITLRPVEPHSSRVQPSPLELAGLMYVALLAEDFEIDVPFGDTVSATETLTLTYVDCRSATGTFIPSFNATAQGFVGFSGLAVWTAIKD